MGLFGKVFQLVDPSKVNANEPKMLALPRAVANELVLASILIPFANSELNSEYTSEIFCSDASAFKGAFCSAVVPPLVNEVLWQSTKSKGAYSRLLSPVEVAIKNHQSLEVEEGETLPEMFPSSPQRPLAFRFQFLEIFSGPAKITKAMSARGWTVCPPIDISFSPEYDMTQSHVMSWVSHLIVNRLIESFSVEPPRATFSIMRRPQLRSKQKPYGFDTEHEQTRIGTLLALRGLQCLHLGERAVA